VSSANESTTYWDSTEAKKIFKPTPHETNALDTIKSQIKTLNSANEAPQSYITIVEGREAGDFEDRITEYQVWCFCQRCQILSLALNIAIEMMPSCKHCDLCCEEAKDQAL